MIRQENISVFCLIVFLGRTHCSQKVPSYCMVITIGYKILHKCLMSSKRGRSDLVRWQRTLFPCLERFRAAVNYLERQRV